MPGQSAQIIWRDGTIPVSAKFDDPYFSLHSGLDETRHVFLAGNDLPARFRDGFAIAELGFGSGLNFLATWMLWDQVAPKGAQLQFTSFEAFPMPPADQARVWAHFPDLAPYADRFALGFDAAAGRFVAPGITLQVVYGDARTEVADWAGMADAWFLDGFSPAKNPQMWQADLMAAVYAHTRAGGSAATYTAAGFVRRNLTDAGFAVTRIPGFGRKRHMSVAHKSEAPHG